MTPKFHAVIEEDVWPLARTFVIARGAKNSTIALEVKLSDGKLEGRGECIPSKSNNEELSAVKEDLFLAASRLREGVPLTDVILNTATFSARSALDCAYWDLRAKKNQVRVWEMAQIPVTPSIQTCVSIGIGTPSEMARAASNLSTYQMLKLKLDGDGDVERIEAVRNARPDATLIADANESWTLPYLQATLPVLKSFGIQLLEQPLHRSMDEQLRHIERAVPICADESFRTASDLLRLSGAFDYVNIKLEKAGGFSAALEAARKASDMSFGLMVGCMVGTSLNLAPARVLAELCDYADLDAPLLLAQDKEPRLTFEDGFVKLPERSLWG